MEKAFVYGMSVAGNNFTDRIEETLQSGISALLQQCHGLFVQQTEGLTTYQLNFLRLLCRLFDVYEYKYTFFISKITKSRP